MLVRTSFANDARVQKEAASLAQRGYAVKVIALWEPGLGRRETIEGIEVVRPRSRLLRALASRAHLGRKLSPPSKRNGSAERAARRWLYAVISSVDATIFALRALIEVLSGPRPSVIHAHDLNVLPGAWLISRLTGARLVYDSHEIHQYSVSMQVRPSLWRAACRRVERFCIRGADAVITVNEACAKAIARIHRIPRPLVVHNVPAIAHQGVRPARGLRESIGAQASDRVAVYCGSLLPNRGIEQAIAAIARLPNVKLALLGYGEKAYLESLRRVARRAGVEGRLHLVPPVSPRAVSAAIREADVSLVLIQDAGLSYHFSSPNKLFESVHAGIPVIGSDLPEIRRVLCTFDCGLIVTPDEPQSIAEAMERILRDGALRERLAAGSRVAASQINWENEEAKLLSAYERLLGLRVAPSPARETTHPL